MKQEILNYLNSIKIIDTHEHISPEKDINANKDVDFLDMFEPYIADNLISSGMAIKEWVFIKDKSFNFKDRFNAFEPYINNIKCNTYFKALMKVMRDKYGLVDLSYEQIAKANKLMQAENTKGVIQKIMDENNIESLLTFPAFNVVDNFKNDVSYVVPNASDICINGYDDIDRLEKAFGAKITTLDALLEQINITFKNYLDKGITTVKFTSGYNRKLDFEMPTKNDAETAYNKVMSTGFTGSTLIYGYPKATIEKDSAKKLDDYLVNYMLGLAEKFKFAVIFHMGLHAFNYNYIERCEARHLQATIKRFPDVNFVLLHCGMPYIDDAIMLARNYHNVFLNLTWCHIIDRTKTIELIKRCVEQVGHNKVHGFGGDFSMPQCIYGQVEFAKENYAIAFSEMIDNGFITLEESKEILKMWLYDNPKKFYKV